MLPLYGPWVDVQKVLAFRLFVGAAIRVCRPIVMFADVRQGRAGDLRVYIPIPW